MKRQSTSNPDIISSQKRVRFNETSEVLPTIHRQDYSPEEKKATFITYEEAMESKRHVRETVYLMNNGEHEILSDTNLYCTRGLECLTRAGCLNKSNKVVARRAVLTEQAQQWAERGYIYNPEHLAHVSAQASEQSRIAARVTGIVDAEAAALCAGRYAASFPCKPMKVEMARPEVFQRGLPQRVSFASKAA